MLGSCEGSQKQGEKTYRDLGEEAQKGTARSSNVGGTHSGSGVLLMGIVNSVLDLSVRSVLIRVGRWIGR